MDPWARLQLSALLPALSSHSGLIIDDVGPALQKFSEVIVTHVGFFHVCRASRKPRLFRALSSLVCTSSRYSDSASTLIAEPIGKFGKDERPDPIHDAQFDAAELQREKDFSELMAYDAARYAFDESQQWENEHRRNDEFTTLKRQLEGAFTEDAERRDKAFEMAQNSQGYTFSDSDHARQRRFEEGQKKRLEIFEKSYQAWETESEWHNGTQDAAIDSSHQALAEMKQELKQALKQQHESLLEEHEKKFLEGEKRRAEALKAALESGVVPSQGREDTPGKADVPPEDNWILPGSPYLGCHRGRPNRRPRSRSRSSTASSRSRSRSPRSPRSRSRSVTPPPFNFPVCGLPIANGRDYLSTVSEEIDDRTLKQHTPSSDERFQLAQEDRDRRFQDEERRREQQFKDAELDRDEAEVERGFEFHNLHRTLVRNFETELQEYQSTFNHSERLRNQAEDKRSEEYNAQEKLMNAQLDILLAKLSNRNKSRSTVVTTFYESLVNEIRDLVLKHDGVITDAEEKIRRRFEDGQAQVAGTLGDGIPTLNSLGNTVVPYWEYKFPLPFLGGQAPPFSTWPPAPVMPYLPPPMPIIPYHAPYPGAYTAPYTETPSPRPRPLVIPGVPPTIPSPPHFPPTYDIQTAGKYPQSPPSEKANGKKGRKNGHQEAYEASRFQRSTAFFQGTVLRRNLFDAAEAKRQHFFRAGQRTRQDEAEGLLADQARQFRTAQKERQSKFLANEATRARDFNTKEGYRMNSFQSDQLSREQRFHNSVNATTPDCLRKEDERVAALRRWVDSVLAGEKYWTEQYFAAVEQKRDEVFQRWLDLTFKRSNKD